MVERSKQGQTNNKAKQHSTPKAVTKLCCLGWDSNPKAVTFPKKNELPRVGFEPTTCDISSLHACTQTHSQGQPDPLNSAFRLTYNMVLNLLRVEEINPEYMLERSFFQFQNNSSIPSLEKSREFFCARLFMGRCNLVFPYKQDKVAEWLRRWTANPLCSARVGSNPILVEVFLFFYFPYLRIC